MSLPTIDDCEFRADPDGKGRFIGRVKQFPQLRTSPQRNSLDALDAIFDQTRDKIADLESARAGFGPAPLTDRKTR